MATLKAMLHSKTNSKAEKTNHLALRVTANRKRSYVYLGHVLDLKDWDSATEKVKRTHPKHKQLNRLIRKKYDELEDLIFESDAKGMKLTAKQITDSIRNTKQGLFFELAEEHVSTLESLGKHNRAVSDRSKINRITEFAKNSELTFEEINERFLKNLKTHLLIFRGISERSVMNIYVLIRKLYNQAIRYELVEQKHYPFGKGKVKIVYPQTIKTGLTQKEILTIENLDLGIGSAIWHTRNVFLFSFYLAGVRIGDVLSMKWSDIVDNRLQYSMNKNNRSDSLKLPKKVVEILKHYETKIKDNNDFIFPEMKKVNTKNSKAVYTAMKTATKKFNQYLKQIAKLAGIDKKITNHIARHTFGNIAGDQISPQMLQKLYRHSNLSTTIGYQGNFIHKDADDALDSVVNF